ncbi:MAG: 3-dehydroquinate synthase [Candidatus Margulisbacteria bacterium]|nr:3-dehydroquinate synthase [Candidatus Margulisiibacteriota bacterium]
MAKIKVDLKERSYEVIVGAEILADIGKIIESEKWGRDVFIITDPLVNDLYGDNLRKGLKSFKHHTIEIPRGEKNKDLKIASRVYDELVRYSAHRDSLIIAFGGGVVGDLAGFVAATYMRGINYLQVPTTLLAQVDAAIGGKTGVNHPKCKNLIGSFYQPKLVCADVETLTSLPARELRTGLAEVVKYGVIEDADFFKFLEANSHHLNTKAFESPDTLRASLKVWQIIVTESAKIKASVVAKDEKEAGLRMILNYGHTIGHAIETLTRYRAYNHGEAVAIGMVAAAEIASRQKMIGTDSVLRIVDLLEKLGLPTEIEGLPANKVVQALGIDKKVMAGKIQFVLPERIGKAVVADNVPIKVIKSVIEELGCR